MKLALEVKLYLDFHWVQTRVRGDERWPMEVQTSNTYFRGVVLHDSFRAQKKPLTRNVLYSWEACQQFWGAKAQ